MTPPLCPDLSHAAPCSVLSGQHSCLHSWTPHKRYQNDPLLLVEPQVHGHAFEESSGSGLGFGNHGVPSSPALCLTPLGGGVPPSELSCTLGCRLPSHGQCFGGGQTNLLGPCRHEGGWAGPSHISWLLGALQPCPQCHRAHGAPRMVVGWGSHCHRPLSHENLCAAWVASSPPWWSWNVQVLQQESAGTRGRVGAAPISVPLTASAGSLERDQRAERSDPEHLNLHHRRVRAPQPRTAQAGRALPSTIILMYEIESPPKRGLCRGCWAAPAAPL